MTCHMNFSRYTSCDRVLWNLKSILCHLGTAECLPTFPIHGVPEGRAGLVKYDPNYSLPNRFSLMQ